MMIGLLWIIGVYGTSAVILHLIHARYRQGAKGEPVTIALVTRNQENQVEWYVRSLLFVSWLKGRTLRVVVFDEGSEDETLEIVRRLAASRPDEQIQIAVEDLEAYLDAHAEDAIVVHRIPKLGKHEGLPLLQW